jgi:hypothetical protein
MVIGIYAHFFQVIVLATYPQALLGIGFLFPKKKSLNWFIPALVNKRVGSSFTTMGEEGTIWCCLDLKKSKKCCLIWALVIIREKFTLPITPLETIFGAVLGRQR